MSTVLEILKGSLRKIGAIAPGESLASEEASDGLQVLNQMLGGWNTQNLIMLGLEIEEFSLVAGQNSYTLGVGGDFNTAEPIRTDAAFIKYDSNTELPIQIIDNQKWGRLQAKGTESALPTHIYIDHNHPLQKVYVYPTPSEATTLILHNYRKFSSFTSLATSLSLPDGYERAIVHNLAIEMAPEYGKTVSNEVIKIASESLADIKRVNIKSNEVGVDPALISSGGYNWRTGQ